jgi:hypothetical protein
MTNFWFQPTLNRDAAPMHFSKLFTGDDNSARYRACTAIPPTSEKTCAMTAKTAPYQSRHRDSYSAKAPGPVAGWPRRVTQPPFTTGSLAQMFQYVTIKSSHLA